MHNLALNTQELQISKPASIAATAAGSTIADLQNYTGVASIILNHAGIDDTDTSATPTGTVKLQTATDTAFSSAVDVASGAFTVVNTATAGIQEIALDLEVSTVHRYLRAHATIADDSTAAFVYGVTGLFKKRGC